MSTPTKQQPGPSTSRPSSTSSSSVSGYLSNVSPIKISKNNNKYFNAKLQTSSEDIQDVVVFTTILHKDMKSMDQPDASPVKLDNVQQNLDYIALNRLTKLRKTTVDFDRRQPSDDDRVKIAEIESSSVSTQVI